MQQQTLPRSVSLGELLLKTMLEITSLKIMLVKPETSHNL
jgi:hypothetical protein